ncbi:GNAT family N-acetyltransferase [uncultured Thiohalocapsa sp.]|uniref:GNAT family N-acetyltransferase n=1 Tax=uncultured Thiohalocapsa sp. TaxID=768990 RepID=UPI0025ED9B97|nr:GNAT family N-acetyltransferase [uncultured Thiohalocapsa sp.]
MPNNHHTDFRVRRADWEQDGAALTVVRRQVFVREQGVPETLEWDGLDTEAVHLLAEAADGTAIGTARLLPSGQIGRMAVLAAHRRRGVGRALLLELLRIAEDEGVRPLFLHAQVSALPFYAGLGFAPEGEVFDEAGIPHRRMRFADAARNIAADLDTRRLGDTTGVLRLDSPEAQGGAVASLAAQARTELLIASPDLEPGLYDQSPVLDAMLRLAVHRRGRVPVRVLVADADAPVKRGHRLIELSRRFSSGIQIRTLPEELAEGTEPCLLADEVGYTLRPTAARDSLLVDFSDSAHTRRLRRRFELFWQQSGVHPGLRRLYL